MTKDEVRSFVSQAVTENYAAIAEDIFIYLAADVSERCATMDGGKIQEWQDYAMPALAAGVMKRIATLCDESADLWRVVYIRSMDGFGDPA